ncbi:hypothetical protein T4B_10524 [Trichinella pseudospiralis]|uniref:Uncharacterized protein n=1 Tax=Trichinella pseudospiralis TaxID=6337 RepID=A0A0V1GQ12_TRIPS|nr:hypothetical protein T4B_10524 [Trichinella pseudospiralis]
MAFQQFLTQEYHCNIFKYKPIAFIWDSEIVRHINKCPLAFSAAGHVYGVFAVGNPGMVCTTHAAESTPALVPLFATTCCKVTANECPALLLRGAFPSTQLPAALARIILPNGYQFTV